MARPTKTGLDYFPVDTHMEDKVKLIEAKYGLEGFGLLIKLYQKIYTNGYYINWQEENILLFSSDVHVNINRVNNIINDCLHWEIFNKELFENYSILTSHGIQLRFTEATKRRTKVEVIEEYNLLKVEEINGNIVFVSVNPVNVDNNSENANDNEQSKVKESKANKSKEQLQNIAITYEKVFSRMISSFQFELLQAYVVDDGMDSGVVIRAIEIAGENNASSLRYVTSILDTWRNRNVKTPEDAEKAIREHELSRASPDKDRASPEELKVAELVKDKLNYEMAPEEAKKLLYYNNFDVIEKKIAEVLKQKPSNGKQSFYWLKSAIEKTHGLHKGYR